MKRSKRGWGFKVDYDLAIKQDEDLIARLTRLIDNRWFKPAAMVLDGVTHDLRPYSTTLVDLALMDVSGTAVQLGLSIDDLADLACTLHRDNRQAQLDGSVVMLNIGTPGAYKRGDAIADRICAIWDGDLNDEETTRKILKHAETALARHKRNQAKYAPAVTTGGRP